MLFSDLQKWELSPVIAACSVTTTSCGSNSAAREYRPKPHKQENFLWPAIGHEEVPVQVVERAILGTASRWAQGTKWAQEILHSLRLPAACRKPLERVGRTVSAEVRPHIHYR